MKTSKILIIILISTLALSCSKKDADKARTPLLEVEGKFLYLDQVQQIIPPNVSVKDSAEIAKSYIKNWVTDVLLYENAKRNISNKDEIEHLIEDYRRSLTIYQYQQKLIDQRLPKTPSEEEMHAFYEKYNKQLILKENVIKGFLLVVPKSAKKIENVRSWVRSGNTEALENIEKYSIQNAISYDYFAENWISVTDILKKLPMQIEDPAAFVSQNRFYETNDSTKHYFLRILSYKISGQVEPYEMAKQKIANLILNKLKADFISNFEDEIYKDAVDNETINYMKK